MAQTSAKQNEPQARDAGPLTFRAAVQPASMSAEKRTVDLTWTTGAAVRRWDWDTGAYYEELSVDAKHVRMGRLNNGAPFLANHDGGDVARTLGVVESAKIEDGKGVATVRFARAGLDPEADMVFEKIRDGVIQNVSVGYRVHKMEKVEGGQDKTPTYRATDWEPYEISAVAMGADDGAGFRSLFRGVEPHEEQHQMDKTPEQVAAEKAAEGKKRAADLDAANARIAQLEAEKAERERVAGIEHAVRAAKLDDAFARKMVDGKVSLTEARAQVIDALADRSEQIRIDAHQPIEVGEEDREKWVRGVSAALLSKTGKTALIADALADQKARTGRLQNHDLVRELDGFDPRDNGGEFRALTLMELAKESLDRQGVRHRGWSKDQVLNRVFDFYARDNAGQQTAADFSVALENVMYKTLLGAYAQQSDSWRRFFGVESVQDFRNANRYRLGSFGVLDSLDESGEYKHKVIPDAVKQAISVNTYGNKIALSRKAIINDDMGAVVASAERFGRMAGLSLEVAAYTQLALNGGLGPNVTYNGITAPLFDAQFANISTGAALSADALVADQVKMAQQKDISNNEVLDLNPAVLLIPKALEATAKQINRATYDPTAGSAFEAPNKAQNLFRDIVGTARLSGTRRYLFSDQTPALLMVFLNGVQVPFMDQRPGWDIDGVEWKLRLDFNAQGFDPKGAITNAGA